VLDPPGSPETLYTLHTAPQEIGLIAKDVAPDKLLLSHLSPTIDCAKEAVARSIAQNFSGPVEFAKDGMRLIPSRSQAMRMVTKPGGAFTTYEALFKLLCLALNAAH
jgi:hypothetical protein